MYIMYVYVYRYNRGHVKWLFNSVIHLFLSIAYARTHTTIDYNYTHEFSFTFNTGNNSKCLFICFFLFFACYCTAC